MATRIELLIAADHMRKVGVPHTDQVLRRAYCDAADMLESEARLIQERDAAGERKTINRIAAALRAR